MIARIYQPSKTAMSSGSAKTKSWVLEFVPNVAGDIDPLMGWTTSDDTQTQVSLEFESENAAVSYAKLHNIEVTIQVTQKRAANIRAGGYGENFSTHRRGIWTH